MRSYSFWRTEAESTGKNYKTLFCAVHKVTNAFFSLESSTATDVSTVTSLSVSLNYMLVVYEKDGEVTMDLSAEDLYKIVFLKNN